jgi:hypothetical protein
MTAAQQIPKTQVLDTITRIGSADLARDAERELPDPVDIKRHQQLLTKFGLGQNQLIDREGGSP